MDNFVVRYFHLRHVLQPVQCKHTRETDSDATELKEKDSRTKKEKKFHKYPVIPLVLILAQLNRIGYSVSSSLTWVCLHPGKRVAYITSLKDQELLCQRAYYHIVTSVHEIIFPSIYHVKSCTHYAKLCAKRNAVVS